MSDITQSNIGYETAVVRSGAGAEKNLTTDLIIEPTIDHVDDRLFIDLRIKNEASTKLPEQKEQYKLIIDTIETEFDLEVEDDKNVVLDTEFPECFDRLESLILKYDKDLAVILIIIGEDPTINLDI